MPFTRDLNTEFKQEFTADIKKEIVAFANTQGGTIYIGIDHNKNVLGAEQPGNVLLQVVDIIRHTIKPDLTPFASSVIEKIKEREIIKISVQRGVARPYYLSDKGLTPSGVYVRQGSASIPASEKAIQQMIKETGGDAYEQRRSLRQDLTFEYLSTELKKQNLHLEPSQMIALGLQSTDGLYTNLGLLLSEQCLHTIKVACFQGSDKSLLQDRQEFSGSLLKQVTDVYTYLDLFNKTEALFQGLERLDKGDYPPEVLRETLLNAIVHREYAFSGSTFINIYDDRMEFVSLGGLVNGLSLEDIMLGISQSRNEKLVKLLYHLKYLEAYGTGISKILSGYQNSKTKPMFKATNGAFQTILPNLNYAESSVAAHKAAPIITDAQFRLVLDGVTKQGSITRQEAQTLLKVGQTRALGILQKMVNAGILNKTGVGKNTKYQA